ncbi:MAG: YdeI/OmpD-associated family protein [Acidobacteriota bacterium]
MKRPNDIAIDGPLAEFISTVELTDSTPPWHILKVPKNAVADFGFTGNLRRVICTLNDAETFNCALFPAKGDYFITLNKQFRTLMGLRPGDSVRIRLTKDNSKYGMPMPAEFEEVLRQDAEGKRLFEALSPGDQRLMLKLVVFVKNVDGRIARALVGIELLKLSGGQFEYHTQHGAMRIASSTRRVQTKERRSINGRD